MMGWSNITSSGVVVTKPVILHSITVTVSVAGDGVTIYEGQDAASGRKIIHYKSLANRSHCCRFSPGLNCSRGVYIALDAGCDEVLVQWGPQK